MVHLLAFPNDPALFYICFIFLSRKNQTDFKWYHGDGGRRSIISGGFAATSA